MILIHLAVSITEPPPTAIRKSALLFFKISNPSLTFATLGLGLISLYTSYGKDISSKSSVTLLVTFASNRDLSVTTKAFSYSLPLISSSKLLLALYPK